ncbi:hypothetical protein J3F83DRAFT_726912 [Trichoderma novae-zelandiae]
MGYRWEEHRETCYRLYIQQGWPLERIMAYLQSSASFAPSRRAFQDQFRRWEFPPKVKSHEQDGGLVARTRELWETNLSQGGMTQVLRQEGFQVTSADVAKLRAKIGLHIRGPNVDKSKSDPDDGSQLLETEETPASMDVPCPLLSEGGEAMSRSISAQSSSSSSPLFRDSESSEPRDAKRRRKTRKDASGGTARYPSEMTLDDARRKLGLDKTAYRSLRDVFTKVCAALNVSRKVDEPEKWESAKTRLMHDLPMLYEKLCTPRDELEMKQVALDAICKDVAKSKRYTESKMTQVEAKVALRINPQQAREMRLVLTELLEASGFANRPDGTLAPTPTPQQWDQLKSLWSQRSGPVRRILNEIGSGQGEGSRKAKALDSLARDILKRLRDNRPDRHSRKQQQPDQAAMGARQSHADLLQGTESPQVSQPSADRTDLGHGLSTATSQPYTDSLPVRDGSINPLPDPPPHGRGMHPLELHLSANTFDNAPEDQFTTYTGGMLGSEGGAMSHYLSGVSMDPHSFAWPRQQHPQVHPQPNFTPAVTSDAPSRPPVEQSLLFPADVHAGLLAEPYAAQPPTAQMLPHGPSTPGEVTVYFCPHPSSIYRVEAPLWVDVVSSQTIEGVQQAIANRFPGAACLNLYGVFTHNGGQSVVLSHDYDLMGYLSSVKPPILSVQLVHELP